MLSSRVVLDVAPQAQIQQVLERQVGHRYLAIDRSDELPVDLVADLVDLPFASRSVDMIICYHVLEHVPDDASAMEELARILDPSGVAVVQVPQRAHAPTIEDPSAPAEVRVRKFGQADHVRYYGKDFADRLLENGLDSHTVEPHALLDDRRCERFGIAPEPVWLCWPAGQRSAHGLDDIVSGTLSLREDRPELPPPRPKRRTKSLPARMRDLSRWVSGLLRRPST